MAHSREHSAARLLRSVWGLPLRAAADASGTDWETLQATLATLPVRGGCAAVLADAATSGMRAATASVMCPPAAAAALWQDPARRCGIEDPHTWTAVDAVAMVRLSRRLRGDGDFDHVECPPTMRVAAVGASHKTVTRLAVSGPAPPEALAAATSTESRWAALLNPVCPVSVLRRYALGDDDNARAQVAINPALASDLHQTLLRDPEQKVRAAALAGLGLTSTELAGFSAGEISERHAVAAHPNTSETTLRNLATDPEPFVRGGVAQNPSTRPAMLAKLARDDDDEVLERTAENPNCPTADLLRLADHSQLRVVRGVARNPNTPPETLRRLVTNDDEDINIVVAANPSSPAAVLYQLADHRDERVKLSMIENPSVSDETIMKLSADPDLLVSAMAVHELRGRLRARSNANNDE